MRGLTPRLVESIFQSIFDAPSNLEFTVKVSFLEIYMERIKDLLNRKISKFIKTRYNVFI